MPHFQSKHEEVLQEIPNTAIVFFKGDLTIQKTYDSEGILNRLFPGQHSIQQWSKALDSDLKMELEDLMKRESGGAKISRNIEYTCGRISLAASKLKDENGDSYGLLFFQLEAGNGGTRNKKLIREKEEAEESNEIKSRFLARISHEIRTPLNAIIGFVEQLQKTDLNKQQRNFAGIVENSSIYLLDLVNEILSFSRLESGEMKLDEVDFSLENLIEEIYNTLKVRAEEKKINLRYVLDEDLKIICFGDAFRLKQILMNLLSNGIKFTDYGFVELAAHRLEKKGDLIWARFTISDSGIGIPREKLTEIFEEYKQASVGIARKHGGSGLGLTISKRLTGVMKGKLTVESKMGKGSVFTVDLPLKISQKKYLAKDILQVDSKELSGRTVLLVDDDAMNRALGQIILEGFNMKVSVVTDGKEAMEVFQKGEFELILLDIHMPEISGFQVADYIRNQAGDQEVRIIAVTADIVQEDEQMLARNQMDAVLIKPYKEINLYNRICQVLGVDTKIILKESLELTTLGNEKDIDVDLSELKAVTKGNNAFFNEMIDTFIENSQQGMEQFRQALEKENWEEIGEVAHRLIPSYKHLKINAVVSDLVDVKGQARGVTETKLIKSLIDAIEETTLALIDYLKGQKYPE